MKLGRNEKCPCGSGRKYKKCCLEKVDDKEFLQPDKFLENYKNIKKDSRIKQCLYPDNSSCSERIIGAHSIQNNKILKRISTKGEVYMPCPKNDNPFEFMPKWGRKQATVFTGFCGYHDNEVFKPIENEEFDKSELHIFLYIYRCFAIEYHKKMEVINMELILTDKLPSRIKGIQENFSGFELAKDDLEVCRIEFDNALLNEKYDILSSVVWEFDKPIKFAASGFTALAEDLEGNKIQDLTDIDTRMKHIFVTIFPEGEKSYCIISWLKSNDTLFEGYKKQLNELDIHGRKIYINNLLPVITENITVNPEAWDKLEKYKKEEFGMLIYGMADLYSSFSDEYYNMLEPVSYDLFEL
ncbi:YecA family protein [Clostridium amylolyticum]|uniref:YecA family protein n=1 Tax=Clostridium amylolyticum TaxID=1121298 RepID=UPI0009329D80|nr:SEC-C metal-binding domain-containing protein [Clostridium amylolyticum]